MEALVHDHLGSITEITDIVGSRIYSRRVPAGAVYPLVRAWRRGGTFRDADHVDQAILQVEVWSGNDGEEVEELTRIVRAALTFDEIVGVHTLGVVTNSIERSGTILLPDQVTGRDRYLFDVQIDTHPAT